MHLSLVLLVQKKVQQIRAEGSTVVTGVQPILDILTKSINQYVEVTLTYLMPVNRQVNRQNPG
jgi:hypothetical protein